jgi:hypothetical protein
MGFPSASVLGWQSSLLPTDYVGMAKVSRRARDVPPLSAEECIVGARIVVSVSPVARAAGYATFGPGLG